jgi:transcriptional regulator with XRE-family HTH domain
MNDKIRALMQKEEIRKKALAEKLGLDPSYFNKMLKGERRWQLEYLEAIADHFKVDLWELMRPEDRGGFQQPKAVIIVPGVEYLDQMNTDAELYLAVPLVEGPIAAGYAGAIPGDYVKSLVWVHKPEIGSRQHHNLRAVQLGVDAYSMEPTIRHNDIVLIDPHDREIIPKGIYAVRLDSEGGCAIKRVRVNNDFAVLLSDNPDFDPIILTKDRAENLIIGKVIWSWTSWVG